MPKEIFVFGDIELGGGTLTDDFIADKTLGQVFHSFVSKKHSVDLILNGDTFDFLKCPYIDQSGKITYPRHITAQISLTKLNLMYKSHHRIFNALKEFAQQKNHRIFFIIGNHDHDLFFPQIQHHICSLLKSQNNILFQMAYNEHELHIEHGHQYDFLNKINHRKEFMNYQGQKILNIPWVSFGLISNFMTLKEEHPFLERIKPLPLLFSHHQAVASKVSWKTIEYFSKSVFYYPLRYCFDPTYVFPKWLFREFYRRVKNRHWDVDKIVNVFKRKKRHILHKNKIYIFGHIHEKYIEEQDGWVIIHPDTWRDEYTFNTQSGLLIPKVKRYVHIQVLQNKLKWNFVDQPIKRKPLRYEDVILNEFKYLKVAQKAENSLR